MTRSLSKALEIASFVIVVVIGLVGAFMLVMALTCCACPPTTAQASVSYDVTLYSGQKVVREWRGCERLMGADGGGVKLVCDGKTFYAQGGAIVIEYHEVG